MLIFKRIITASISFLILFFVFYFGAMIIGGAVVGTAAGIKHPENRIVAAELAGEQFALKWFGIITLSAVVLSGALSAVLAFGGLLPWCRRRQNVLIESKKANDDITSSPIASRNDERHD